jgi:hypothetical protein
MTGRVNEMDWKIKTLTQGTGQAGRFIGHHKAQTLGTDPHLGEPG